MYVKSSPSNSNEPYLRFENFNKKWSCSKLENIFKISAGGDIERQNFSKEYSLDFPYPVYANALTNQGLYGYANYYKVDGDSVTVTGRGDVGHAIARYNKYVPIVRLLSLVPQKESNVLFFENAINSTKIFVESTGVPQLTSPQLGAIKIYYPEIDEQNKIADFLSLIDKRIDKQHQLVENLKKYKRGLLVSIIDNLSEIKETSIGAFFYVQGGYAFKGELFQKTGIPIVRISNINDNNIDLTDLIFYDSNIHIDSKFIIKNGDILIAMSGATTGKIGKYNNKGIAYLNQRVGKFIQKNNDADIGYLYQLLSSEYFTKGLKNLLVAGAQPNISPSDIESIVLPFPKLKYQEKISNLLSRIDIQISKENEMLTKILSIKQGLLQQMFI